MDEILRHCPYRGQKTIKIIFFPIFIIFEQKMSKIEFLLSPRPFSTWEVNHKSKLIFPSSDTQIFCVSKNVPLWAWFMSKIWAMIAHVFSRDIYSYFWYIFWCLEVQVHLCCLKYGSEGMKKKLWSLTHLLSINWAIFGAKMTILQCIWVISSSFWYIFWCLETSLFTHTAWHMILKAWTIIPGSNLLFWA